MKKEYFLQILHKYLSDSATAEEVELLETWYSSFEPTIDILEQLTDTEKVVLKERIRKAVMSKIKRQQPTAIKIRPFWYQAAAAAAVIIAITSIYWLYFDKNPSKSLTLTNVIIKDVEPGKLGATLQLSNGITIILDTAQNGRLVDGFTKSDSTLKIANSTISYATLTTPLGRTQKLALSDGTIVWLNAGSSIKFPTLFNRSVRSVEIMGEVYFEVAHNKEKPFIVKVGNQEIKVLGTHFNINAYLNEGEVKSTLLEGSIEINGNTILKPGEQYMGGHISKVNTEASVAWVNGMFHFDHADIYNVMRQLSRWYDIEVLYEGKISNETFGGDIPRDLNLSRVLDAIGSIGLHYTLEGKKLTIRP